MRTIIGVGIMLGGVLFGVYIGIWVMFIGGIVQVIEQIRAEDLKALSVAIGVAKVFFATPVGVICGLIPIGIGRIIISD